MSKQYLSMTLADAYGRETVKRIEIKVQESLAEYSTVGSAIITALEAITDLAVVRADLVLGDWIELSGSPAAGANVDVGATFQCELAGEANRKAAHKVPGITASFVGGDGTIDITQTEVDAYLDLFLEANECLLSDGESVGSWIRGTLDR